MKQVRRRKVPLAWIAIVALLGHAVLSVASKPLARADGILGPLVICTADGAKVVPGDGNPDAPGPCNHCPACVPLAHFALAVIGGDPVAIVFPAPAALRPPQSRANPLAVHLIHGAIYSRGPPPRAA
jgi:Protein of unknown function (DUF2946)